MSDSKPRTFSSLVIGRPPAGFPGYPQEEQDAVEQEEQDDPPEEVCTRGADISLTAFFFPQFGQMTSSSRSLSDLRVSNRVLQCLHRYS